MGLFIPFGSGHYEMRGEPGCAVPVWVPAQPKEPLSFDRLQQVMAQHFGGRELTDDEADSAEAFARAIERAHGIGA
jgi:hypothetical protein